MKATRCRYCGQIDPTGAGACERCEPSTPRKSRGVRRAPKKETNTNHRAARDAGQILADLELRRGACSKSYIRLAYRLADDEGTIQAGDMLKLTSAPTEHTTSNLREVLLRAGCKEKLL